MGEGRGKLEHMQLESSLEFIASLQEQARKLSDKKINGILLDPFANV